MSPTEAAAYKKRCEELERIVECVEALADEWANAPRSLPGLTSHVHAKELRAALMGEHV